MSAPRRNSARGDVAEAASPDKAEKRGRPAKPKAADAERKSLFVARGEQAKGLYLDTMSEMRKITWPDQETTRNLTIVVVGISVVMGALLGTVDYLLVQLLGLF